MMNTTKILPSPQKIPHDLIESQTNRVTLLRRRFSRCQLEVSIEKNGYLRGWVTSGETREVKLKGLPAYLNLKQATQLLKQSYLKFQKGAIEVLPKGLGGMKHSRPSVALGLNKAGTYEEEALQLVEAISDNEERKVVRKAVKKLLKNDPEKKDLYIGYRQIGAESVQALGVALQVNQSLQSLNLEFAQIGAAGAQAIGVALQVNQTLQELDLKYNPIGAAGAQALGAALQVNQSLQSLNLEFAQIGAAGAQALGAALQVNQSLQSLNLERNHIGDVGDQALGGALQVNQSLQSLNLEGNNIGAAGAQALGAALQVNQSLQSLNLVDNHIGDVGAQALGAALQVNQSLQLLNLIWNDIGDVGAQALGGALKVNQSLQSLNLEYNHIGDVGAQALGAALQVNQSLQSLNLEYNQIGDVGAQALGAALQVNQSLQLLNLLWNDIGVAGAQALVETLQVNQTLQELDLNGNQIGGDMKTALKDRINTLLKENKQIATAFQQQIKPIQDFLQSHQNEEEICLSQLQEMLRSTENIIPSLNEMLNNSSRSELNSKHKEKLKDIVKNLTNRLHDLWLELFEQKLNALSNEYVMNKEPSKEPNVNLGYALYETWLTFLGSDCPNWAEDHLESLLPFGVLLDIAEGGDKQDISELKDPHLLFQRVLLFRNESKDSLFSLATQPQKS